MGFGNEVAVALNAMREEKETYRNYLPQHHIMIGNTLVETVKDLWNDILEEVLQLLKKELPLNEPYAAVWWYSVLVNIKHDSELFLDFIKYIRKNYQSFSSNTNYFLFYQLKSLRFRYPEFGNEGIQIEIWKYFEDIVKMFENNLDVNLEKVPLEKRDSNRVVVITEQFIAIQHGPTKTALDRCRCLINQMGKSVLLINTTEVLSNAGQVPFYETVGGSCDESKQDDKMQTWKGVQIPYYQCEHNMPDCRQLELLLSTIRKMAPQYVVSIGGSGMLSNLVNKMIPVVTIGLCPSDLEFTTTQFQTLGRKIENTDRKVLKSIGYEENRVIESIFTSSLKTQTEHITREEQNLPEDKFILVTVGSRLNDEITDDFLNMLQNCMTSEMYWVIIGSYTNYENMMEKFPKLKAQSKNLGFCNDILSRIELCDLYVNPTRKGGGTSSVEALYKGVPVVSVNYGDVAINVGEKFCVKNYSEMEKEIVKYFRDGKFYDERRQMAYVRVKKLLDTDGEFVRIMREANRREMM